MLLKPIPLMFAIKYSLNTTYHINYKIIPNDCPTCVVAGKAEAEKKRREEEGEDAAAAAAAAKASVRISESCGSIFKKH